MDYIKSSRCTNKSLHNFIDLLQFLKNALISLTDDFCFLNSIRGALERNYSYYLIYLTSSRSIQPSVWLQMLNLTVE